MEGGKVSKSDKKGNAFRFADLIEEKRAFGPINYRQVSKGGLQVPVRKLSWVGGRHLIKPSVLAAGFLLIINEHVAVRIYSRVFIYSYLKALTGLILDTL